MKYLYRALLSLGLAGLCLFGAYQLLLRNVRTYFIDFSKNESIFLGRDTTHYDVLLLGSSRMLNTVNPRVLDSALGCNSFNLGQSGAALAELTANLKGYLATHPAPRLVCVALDVHMIGAKKNFMFYPYYLTSLRNAEIRQALQEDGIKVHLYRYLPFLMASEYGDYFRGTFIKNALHKTELGPGDFYYKGYKSNFADTLDPVAVLETARKTKIPAVQVTEKGKEALNELIRVCEANHITLVGTYAPEFRALTLKGTPNGASIVQYYDSVLQRHGVRFIQNQYLPLCEKPAYFANVGHVNRFGADLYSAYLGDTLRRAGVFSAAP